MNNPKPADIYNRLLSFAALLPGCLLFFMMLFVPTAYKLPKAGLMAVILLFISIGIFLFYGRIRLHKTVFMWTFFYLVLGFLWIVNGYIRDAPGAIRVASVFIIWPSVYLVFISGISSEKTLRTFIRVLVYVTIAIAVYDIVYVLNAIGLFPDFLFYRLEQDPGIGLYSGFMRFKMNNISSLLFLVPFLMAAIITWGGRPDAPASGRLLWLALILGMITVLMAGRRALLLVVGFSPVIALILSYFLPGRFLTVRNVRRFIFIIICLLLLLIILVISLNLVVDFKISAIFNYFLKGFDFLGSGKFSKSANIRYEQFVALMEGWQNYPLFGGGHGAGVSLVRSREMPWAYELSYVALLFQTGLVGFTLYASGVVWIYWMGIRMIRSGNPMGRLIIPVLTGTTCFLIGTATNPYLAKYDYIWVIFLPLAFINYWLLKYKHIRKNEPSARISQVKP